LIDLLGLYSGKFLVESFIRNDSAKQRKIAIRNIGARKQYSFINFLGGFIEGLS